MANPFTCYFNGQPPAPPVVPQVITRTNNSFPFSVSILFIGLIILLSLVIVSSCTIDQYEDERVVKKSIEVVKVVANEPSEYKNFVAPKSGTLKLTKGTVSQVHHGIKEDSVIILSRKSISGRAGQYLSVQEIVPNKKFTIVATDELGEVEAEDCGEIYFQVL